MLLNAALNMVDDAVFTMMDMANGMDPMAAMEGLGKKALVSVASSAASGVANGFGSVKSAAGGVAASGTATTSNTFMDSGLKGVLGLKDSVIGSTLLKGTELMATNVSTSAINAVSLKGLLTGGDAFDERAFKQGAFGKSAMTSVAAGMAGTAVTTGMGKWDMTDGNKTALNRFTFDTENIQRFNGFVGSMAGSAVTYGLTGNAKFNVARVKGVGIMEMNLGKDGFGMNMGMGGTDISMGTLSSAMSGYKEANKVSSWKFGSNEQQKTLNGINMMGWTGELGNAQNVGVSRAIWSGKLKATYKDMAENENGYYDRGIDSGEIVLSSAFLGGGKEAAAKLATVMSHEGSHWSGNHIEGLAHEQGMKTYAEINAMFGLAGDSQFSQSMADAYVNPESWKENDSSRDYWRKTINGDIKYDGNIYLTEEYYNDDGSINTDGRVVEGSEDETSMAGALVKYLGQERANELMNKSKMQLSTGEYAKSIKDIYGVDEITAIGLAQSPQAFTAFVQAKGNNELNQRYQGEILMKKNGYSYDSNNKEWTGLAEFTMTDLSVPRGSINTVKLDNGVYQNSVISLEATRNLKGFKVYNHNISDTEEAQKNYLNAPDMLSGNKNNTQFNFVQRDLNGKVLSEYNPQDDMPDMRINSFDVLKTSMYGTNMPYADLATIAMGWGVQQGSTVVSGFSVLMMPTLEGNTSWGLNKGDMIFAFTSGKMLNGKQIGVNGVAEGEKLRTLIHPSGYGNSDSCFIPYSEFGGAAAAGANFRTMTDYLRNNWGLKTGTMIPGKSKWIW